MAIEHSDVTRVYRGNTNDICRCYCAVSCRLLLCRLLSRTTSRQSSHPRHIRHTLPSPSPMATLDSAKPFFVLFPYMYHVQSPLKLHEPWNLQDFYVAFGRLWRSVTFWRVRIPFLFVFRDKGSRQVIGKLNGRGVSSAKKLSGRIRDEIEWRGQPTADDICIRNPTPQNIETAPLRRLLGMSRLGQTEVHEESRRKKCFAVIQLRCQ